MLNTSAITAVIKYSMKPRSGAAANRHLCGSGERNGEQRRTKISLDIKLCLSEGISQSVGWSVSQSVEKSE